MYSLFKKEIITFLGSLTGYLVVVLFLLVTGLFLWIFPGAYNIPENGYASLEGLFNLAPWLYLFLIPAITMRFIADEKRSGTLETLLTHPISDFKIVFAKYLAGLFIVLFSILPTLLYFLSVYLLGNPVGSIDVGASWGSFIGLFFLASIYLAIGILASSLTDNQIVSFILAIAISFVFYLGFDFAASIGVSYTVEILFSWFSINNHYLSISRGVIDMRDIIYFCGMTLSFLLITSTLLRKGRWKETNFKIKSLLYSILLASVFIISTNFLYRYDLTSDNRYSLSDLSKEKVADLEYPIEITLFLEGELEPGLRKLQTEIIEKVAVLNAYAAKPIRINIFDPYSIKNKKKHEDFVSGIVRKGVTPINFRHKTDKGISEKLIFPGALIKYGKKEMSVNFLKNNPDFTPEINFNHSIESTEFEILNTFQKLMRTKKSKIAFLEGQKEAERYEVMDITNWLSSDYDVVRISTEALKIQADDIGILIIANPQKSFSENEKIIIDQYIMKGGKVIWLIEPVSVSLDSLSGGFETYSFPRDLNLGDQLFRYGVRLNYELLQDVICAGLPVNTALKGNQPKFTMHPWYYSPLLTPNDNHPASKNLNRVFTEFVSSIDTLSGNPEIKKHVILSTSPNARKVSAPSSVSLKNINNPPARELFNLSNIPVAVILEGVFTSVYKNRMVENYGFNTSEIITESKPTKMVVIADGGLIMNKVDYTKQPPNYQEVGYDWVSKQTYGNRDFLLNTIYYLTDGSGIMQLRSRTLKLRLLDKVKLREEKRFWQLINVVFPLLFVLLFGMVYNFIRKQRFSR